MMPSKDLKTIYLKADVHRKLKILAAQTDRNIYHIVNEVLRKYIEEEVPERVEDLVSA